MLTNLNLVQGNGNMVGYRGRHAGSLCSSVEGRVSNYCRGQLERGGYNCIIFQAR